MTGWHDRSIVFLMFAAILLLWPSAARAQDCYISTNGDYICDDYQSDDSPKASTQPSTYRPVYNNKLTEVRNYQTTLHESRKKEIERLKAAFLGSGCVVEGPLATGTNVINVSSASELQAALNRAKAGDVIKLAPGTYKGNFTLKNGGTKDKPVIIDGIPGVIITNSGGPGHLSSALSIEASNVVVRGLTFDGKGGVNSRAALLAGSSKGKLTGLVIENNVIKNWNVTEPSRDDHEFGMKIGTSGQTDGAIIRNNVSGERPRHQHHGR